MSEFQTIAGQIGRASAVIMILSMADKILAVGKEILTANRFGVSVELDVFNIAYMFPGILVLLLSAALVSAFVPLYLEWLRQSSLQDADSHATWLIYLTTLFFAVFTIICFFLGPLVINVIGYGFNPEEKQLGAVMVRLLVLLILIDGAGILFTGILLARKKFFHLYVAPIFVNITIISLLLLDIGPGIYSLVWGFLIGVLIKTLYLGVALHREGFLFRTPLPLDPAKIKTLWFLALPLLGSELIANANLVVDQAMATMLPAGSVSTLRYAFRINDLPIQVIITAISRAVFPFISEEAAAGNHENLKNLYKYSLIFLGFLTIPITCFVVLFSDDIVTLLLKRGAFDLEATAQTAGALSCYSIGLFFYAYTFVNGSFFAALKSTKTLLYMGFASILLNAFFNIVLMKLIGIRGIALSTSITMAIISICFIFLLKQKLGLTELSDILPSFYRLILAAATMLGTGFLLFRLFETAGVTRLVYAPMTAAVISLTYLGVVWVFRTEYLRKSVDVLMHMLTCIIKRKT